MSFSLFTAKILFPGWGQRKKYKTEKEVQKEGGK
jgi:hypothetical protein